jgi:hypothetical protein
MYLEAFVDSALLGKNAELLFSWTEVSFPKRGPNTPLAPNHRKMTRTAAHTGRRKPFWDFRFTGASEVFDTIERTFPTRGENADYWISGAKPTFRLWGCQS